MKPFQTTATVIPCRTRTEAEETSRQMRAHGDVLIARRPRWYVAQHEPSERTAEWCLVVLEGER